MTLLVGILGLFDSTINALFSVPVLAFFLGGMVLCAVLGLVLLLKDAAGGGRSRR